MFFLKQTFLLSSAAALLICTPAQAQKSPQDWGKALQKLVQTSARPPKCLPKPLSLTQIAALENRVLALNALTRALRRSPYLPHTPEFASYSQTLRLLDVDLPVPPAENAPESAKRDYAHSVRRLIAQRAEKESAALAHYSGVPADKMPSVQHVNWARRRSEMTRSNGNSALKWKAFENAVADGKKYISWGTPGWDEIRLGPAKLPSDPQDPLYACRAAAQNVVNALPEYLTDALDLITFDETLNPFQKNTLQLHLAQASDLAGWQALYAYMRVFGKFPVLNAPGLMPSSSSRTLSAYARNTQIALIEKLKRGEVWTDAQADAFIDLAAFLPGHNGRDVLAALTYLEPKAALYLLTHPGESEITRRIRQETDAAREKAQAVWMPNRVLPKTLLKQKTEVFGSNRHLMALLAYYDLLTHRMETVQQRLYTRRYWLKNYGGSISAQRKDQLAYKLYSELEERRLQEIYELLLARQREVQTELVGFYRVSQPQ